MLGTVLVIDDSPEVLAVVAARLRPEGYRVLIAPDWTTGLDIAVELRPDLILLDLEMPEQNGLDVCRRLKVDPRTSSIPVIFLTACHDVEMKVHGFDLGAADYVTKPFHPAELRARVRVAVKAKQQSDDLDERARVDALTGLFNRREFDALLAKEITAASRNGGDLALLLFDLDHFKTLNDSHGHAFGDTVLQESGRLLMRSVRSGDHACRYGGEELAVIMPRIAVGAAIEAATRIASALRSLPFRPGADFVSVTASVGVASLQEVSRCTGSSNSAALLDAADTALYAAKRTGRDRVVGFPVTSIKDVRGAA